MTLGRGRSRRGTRSQAWVRRIADRAGAQSARRLHGTLIAGQENAPRFALAPRLSFPAREGVQLRGCGTQESHGRVRSSLRPDVGCGGRGFPAWLAEVGARGLRVLLALGELSRQGAPFSGPIGFPDQPRSFSDREWHRMASQTECGICLEELPTLPQRIGRKSPL